MYEMCVCSSTGSALVWHVAAKHGSRALCGQQLQASPDPPDAEAAPHCEPCMESFRSLMAEGTALE
ncbi:hypothetical protein IHE55_23640 [Streptomyces pactum]|uniref:Uncharacterized protein n=2 Tax=Streptomyces pactum TaxID=68249 RepID=A0ABS0NQW6_9ACTN|nr:hypothetical protein [Streptomyces pactum]